MRRLDLNEDGGEDFIVPDDTPYNTKKSRTVISDSPGYEFNETNLLVVPLVLRHVRV